MKEKLLALLEDAKTELHQAVDAVAADAPEIEQTVLALAAKHQVVQGLVKLLASL